MGHLADAPCSAQKRQMIRSIGVLAVSSRITARDLARRRIGSIIRLPYARRESVRDSFLHT